MADLKMIPKVDVRRELASYENKLRKEIKSIREEMEAMKNACSTLEMQGICRRSGEYRELYTKLITLSGVLNDIIDMRCSKIFEEN